MDISGIKDIVDIGQIKKMTAGMNLMQPQKKTSNNCLYLSGILHQQILKNHSANDVESCRIQNYPLPSMYGKLHLVDFYGKCR